MKRSKFPIIVAAVFLVIFVAQAIILWQEWRVILGFTEHLPEVDYAAQFDPDSMESRTFQTMEQQYAWQAFYEKSAPVEGSPAPDFELGCLDGSDRIKLSDFREKKPVALVFGSFT